MDPQQRLLLETAYSAMHAAEVRRASLMGSEHGVFLAISNTDYAQLLAKNDSVYAATGSAISIAAGRLSFVFGLQGPCVSIDTACSSSLVALHAASHGIHQLTALVPSSRRPACLRRNPPHTPARVCCPSTAGARLGTSGPTAMFVARCRRPVRRRPASQYRPRASRRRSRVAQRFRCSRMAGVQPYRTVQHRVGCFCGTESRW